MSRFLFLCGSVTFFVCTLLLPSSAGGSNDRLVFSLDFNSPMVALQHPWFFHLEGLEVAAGAGIDGSPALRATYRGNRRGSQRMIHAFDLGEAGFLQATLGFKVKFCDGFKFVRGGKLHGLGPSEPASGGQVVLNGRWSARLLFTEKGGLSTYVYHYRQAGRYGESVQGRNFRFQPDRWYALKLSVHLNDMGRSNGEVQVSVDGVPLIAHRGLTFYEAGAASFHIKKFFFSTFFGGQDESYAPKDEVGRFTNVCAYFDDFYVTVDD